MMNSGVSLYPIFVILVWYGEASGSLVVNHPTESAYRYVALQKTENSTYDTIRVMFFTFCFKRDVVLCSFWGGV